MTTLDRAAILAAQDIQTEVVNVPEWGGDVRVRGMTGVQRDAFDRATVDADGKADLTNFAARLAATCVVDDQGNPLFTLDDIDLLADKSGAALQRVSAVAMRLSGLGAEGAAAAKNGSAAPSGADGSV